MNYKDLDVWNETRLLANEIYQLTKGFLPEELYGLSSQMRRRAISVPSNIAEGYGRKNYNDSIRFFYIKQITDNK